MPLSDQKDCPPDTRMQPRPKEQSHVNDVPGRAGEKNRPSAIKVITLARVRRDRGDPHRRVAQYEGNGNGRDEDEPN